MAPAGAGLPRQAGPMAGDLARLTEIANRHGGIVSISDVQACGFTRSWASLRVGSGRWQRVHRGVYAVFPTELTWEQRAHAGLAFAGRRAALCDHAAGHLHGLISTAPDVIEILVPHSTLLTPPTGLALRRTRRRFAVVGHPRRTNLVDTVLDLADRAKGETEVLDMVAAGAGKGAKPDRLLREMGKRRYVPHRALLKDLLARTPDGVESPLELRFHTNVLVAHGLPLPQRQVRERVRGYWIRSDCWYERYGVRVELDGELAHPGRATPRDVLRDNDVLLKTGDITLRYRWWHALEGACVSAAQVASGLSRGGWEGEPVRCDQPRCSAVREFGTLRGTLWG